MVLVVLFVFCLILLFIWRDTRKPEGFPPGPKWLPIVGCIPLAKQLLDIFGYHHLVWQHFATHYGPVVGFRFGQDRLILISGKHASKEFFSREEFNGRPNGFFFRIRSFDQRLGLVFTDGKFWEIQRKFSMKTLKQLGTGRNGLVSHVEKEAEEMISYLKAKSQSGCLLDMHNLFDIPVLNVMWALLAGYRFHLEDERLTFLLEKIHESFRVIDMSGGLINQFPFIRYLLPEKSGYRKLIRTLNPIWSFLQENIEEINDQMSSDNQPKSLIEAFLKEINFNGDKESTFTKEQLLAVCLDIFQAGSETTSNTLGFGLIYMLNHPEVMCKVRQELHSVVGQNRLPKLADRVNLQYVEAVICEIQRFANVAPIGIAHRTMEKTEFFDYKIPKDAIMLVSLYGLNMDVDYWKDPYVFRPERFLNDSGRLIQHELFIPFGLGKRRCMGENLARNSLFLFFSAFFHVFDVKLPEEDLLPCMEPINGITLSPKPFKAQLKIAMQ